jgi:hypothetical protein
MLFEESCHTLLEVTLGFSSAFALVFVAPAVKKQSAVSPA